MGRKGREEEGRRSLVVRSKEKKEHRASLQDRGFFLQGLFREHAGGWGEHLDREVVSEHGSGELINQKAQQREGGPTKLRETLGTLTSG